MPSQDGPSSSTKILLNFHHYQSHPVAVLHQKEEVLQIPSVATHISSAASQGSCR